LIEWAKHILVMTRNSWDSRLLYRKQTGHSAQRFGFYPRPVLATFVKALGQVLFPRVRSLFPFQYYGAGIAQSK